MKYNEVKEMVWMDDVLHRKYLVVEKKEKYFKALFYDGENIVTIKHPAVDWERRSLTFFTYKYCGNDEKHLIQLFRMIFEFNIEVLELGENDVY